MLNNNSGLDYSDAVSHNAKVMRELEVLNEAGDMTAVFFKTKVLMCEENKFKAELDASGKTKSKGKQINVNAKTEAKSEQELQEQEQLGKDKTEAEC